MGERRFAVGSLLNDIAIWKKFALVGALVMALVALPLTLYVNSTNGILASARNESAGVGPAGHLFAVVRALQQHRGLSSLLLSGDHSVSATREATAGNVSKAMTTFETALTAHVHNTSHAAALQDLGRRWTALERGMKDRSLQPRRA